MRRALVTGGAGFIGSHIVSRLVDAGAEVHIIDDLSSGRRENLHPRASFHHLDIRSSDSVQCLREVRPEVIIHAAAQISVRVSMDDPVLDTSINVGGLINLLHGITGGGAGTTLPHFVLLSTGGAIYGEQDTFPAGEDHATRPASVYGLAKRVSELYLDLWARQYGLTFAALRLSNVYGPRQNPHGEAGVVAIFCQRLIKSEQVTIHGSGEQTRDFIFVGDVADAVSMVAQKRVSGIFNIGTARESSVNEIYRVIASTLGSSAVPLYGPAKHGEQMRSSINPALAKATFGWCPQVALEHGLGQTVKWFQSEAC